MLSHQSLFHGRLETLLKIDQLVKLILTNLTGLQQTAMPVSACVGGKTRKTNPSFILSECFQQLVGHKPFLGEQ